MNVCVCSHSTATLRIRRSTSLHSPLPTTLTHKQSHLMRTQLTRMEQRLLQTTSLKLLIRPLWNAEETLLKKFITPPAYLLGPNDSLSCATNAPGPWPPENFVSYQT
jgi:hypothetical protein